MKKSPLVRHKPLLQHASLKRSPMQRKKSSKKNAEYTKELREYIKERDDGRCQICGGAGNQVHHVIGRGRYFAKWYTLRSVHDERNLMYICTKCHRRVDDEAGFVDVVIEIQERRFGKLRKEFG